jgi:hypothetical protein
LRSANRRFFPSTEEFRADAETERQALLARHPFERCAECLDHCGWAPVIVDGVERMQRCSCWDRYLRRMATMGVGTQPLLLVAARQESFS